MAEYLVNFLNCLQGLRKTLVMLSLIVITSVFRAKGLIEPTNFEGILKATVIAYFGSNSIEHYTAMVKERLTSKGTTVPVTEIDSTTGTG